MGQAKQRKAEIAALKAAGSKHTIIKPFMVRGTINPDGTVSFPTDGLDEGQISFVQSCERSINDEQVPEMAKSGTIATEADSLAFVMYHSPDDFFAQVAVGLNCDPDDAWRDHYQRFWDLSKRTKKQYPQIGDSFTREDIERVGTKAAGYAFDVLSEGGQWLWENAHAVLERRGDRLVVVATI